MARYTGLSKEVIDEANLRINVREFTHYLLIDQKLRVGRLDGPGGRPHAVTLTGKPQAYRLHLKDGCRIPDPG